MKPHKWRAPGHHGSRTGTRPIPGTSLGIRLGNMPCPVELVELPQHPLNRSLPKCGKKLRFGRSKMARPNGRNHSLRRHGRGSRGKKSSSNLVSGAKMDFFKIIFQDSCHLFCWLKCVCEVTPAGPQPPHEESLFLPEAGCFPCLHQTRSIKASKGHLAKWQVERIACCENIFLLHRTSVRLQTTVPLIRPKSNVKLCAY